VLRARHVIVAGREADDASIHGHLAFQSLENVQNADLICGASQGESPPPAASAI